MFKPLILTLLIVSTQAAYALPVNEKADLFRVNESSKGCKAPLQGPRGPRGFPGANGAQSYAFFYTSNPQTVPGEGVVAKATADKAVATTKLTGENCVFGIVEFESNDVVPNHANINQAGFILHKDDSTNPDRITAFEVPVTGDYQIIFHITSGCSEQAFALADTTNSTVNPASSTSQTGTVDSFNAFDAGIISVSTYEIVLNTVVHLNQGTLISLINVSGKDLQLQANSTCCSLPNPVIADISFVYLGAGS